MRSSINFALLVLLLSGRAWSFDETTRQGLAQPAEPGPFRAGACAIDVAPTKFPVFVNGNFLAERVNKVIDPINAKCLVLDDGSTRLAIVVVDSCMMPRELLDRAKELAREQTGIASDRILISATHTHSAPAAMGALGCPADVDYAALLPGKIAESIKRASERLEPARVGWTVIDDPEHTFCRRWVYRPDKMLDDPFGGRTVRANMHPGYQNPDAIAPAGPVDPALTILSVRSRTGRPMAVLANYSMHYYGAAPISADYFGRFAGALAKRIGAQAVEPPFVGMMSQGTSGDQMWMDYGQPEKNPGLDAYADGVARFAQRAYESIIYRDWAPLAMAETRIVVDRRVPDAARLAWAKAVIARMAGRSVPNTEPEVYAREAIILHEEPRRELKLQAIRIGELGIAAIPNEVFAITGLKIKARSPFETTMNIELANGSEGYIPPPEQHALGGYTTWPARTAALEVQAEPKIVAAVLGLLEQVADRPRRIPGLIHGPYAESVLASAPLAYWRLDEIQGTSALDSTGHDRRARYEGGFAFYLPGPDVAGLTATKPSNRSVHFAGGRLKARLETVPEAYTVELWFWNGLANHARPVTGVLVALGVDRAAGSPALLHEVGVDGTRGAPGRIFFSADTADVRIFSSGTTEVPPRAWHHLAVVRDGRAVNLYLDGKPEIATTGKFDPIVGPGFLSIGGAPGDVASFEGKIDEVAFYQRALPLDEIIKHITAAGAPSRNERGSSR